MIYIFISYIRFVLDDRAIAAKDAYSDETDQSIRLKLIRSSGAN